MNVNENEKDLWYIKSSVVFGMICCINLMNYVDRGIIPGATNEFNSFIKDDVNTSTPDVYLGLLQSSFIIGFMVGSVFFSHWVHEYGRFYLVAAGLLVWIIAICLCGLSYYTKSYIFLLFCRILSGVGEASIQTSIPPWIQEAAPKSQTGAWLAIFYTAIPVGIAIGYAYSSLVSASLGWEWAFFIEVLIVAPFLAYLYRIAPFFPLETRPGEEHVQKPSLLEELTACCSSSLFLFISLAYAAQAGVMQGLSTFGSAFLMGLGFFDDESQASTVFGAVISVAGMIATPLGGILLDWLLQSKNAHAEFDAPEKQLEAQVLVRENLEDSHTENDAEEAVRRVSHDMGNHSYKAQLDQICKLTTILTILAAIVLCSTYFTRTATSFLILTAFGAGLVFCTYSAINMGVMLSVPIKYRSFGIAINTFFLHALGDVPSPIIVGYLKDALAPGCVGGDDDEVASSPECRDDADGLRYCILLTELWLWWSVLFFILMWYFNKMQWLTVPGCQVQQDPSLLYPLLDDEKRSANPSPAQAELYPDTVTSQLHTHSQ